MVSVCVLLLLAVSKDRTFV